MMNHQASVTLTAKTTNADGSIQVTFNDGTGFVYGDEASLVIDCESKDALFPDYLKSMLVCMLADTGISVVGKTLMLDLDATDGIIVKVV